VLANIFKRRLLSFSKLYRNINYISTRYLYLLTEKFLSDREFIHRNIAQYRIIECDIYHTLNVLVEENITDNIRRVGIL